MSKLDFKAANFADDKKKGKLVPWISFNGEKVPGIGRGFGDKAGCSPEGLLMLLTADNRDELIAMCQQAIAQAAAVNGPAQVKTSTAVYYTFDGKDQAGPCTDATVRAFVVANANNAAAQIHNGSAWFTKDRWGEIGFALPPAPPAPPVMPAAPSMPAPPSNVPAAPAAPSIVKGNQTALEKIVAQRQLATA